MSLQFVPIAYTRQHIWLPINISNRCEILPCGPPPVRVKAASRSDYALDRWRASGGFIFGIDIRVIVFDRYVHRWLVKHRLFSGIFKRKQGFDAGFERSWVYLLSARSESGWMHSFDPFTVESVVFLTISELKSSSSLLARWYACLGRFDNARLFCNNNTTSVKLFIHFSRDRVTSIAFVELIIC